MKFTKIQIKDFQQFKDFELDLTYPSGHPKAGKPLEKVCFIGQSGTGKTTILELLKAASCGNPPHCSIPKTSTIIFSQIVGSSITFKTSFYPDVISQYPYQYDIDLPVTHSIEDALAFDQRQDYQVINFPAKFSESDENYLDEFFDRKDYKLIDFGEVNAERILRVINSEIQAFQEKTTAHRVKMSKASETLDISQIQRAVDEFAEWKKNNQSPIDDLADKCLDKILLQFSLRVRREFLFEKKEDIGYVKIETLDGVEVPFAFASTGTKQILLTAAPLYLLQPKDNIILFDEPERSLFPDIQRKIVNYYATFTEDCQFFYATHSPIIASSFDPAERFILTFDDNGKVTAKRGIAPQGDDSNDLLVKDFGQATSLGIEGEIRFEEFLQLKQKISKEVDIQEKAKLITKYMSIGSDYNFGYDLKLMEDEANCQKHK